MASLRWSEMKKTGKTCCSDAFVVDLPAPALLLGGDQVDDAVGRELFERGDVVVTALFFDQLYQKAHVVGPCRHAVRCGDIGGGGIARSELFMRQRHHFGAKVALAIGQGDCAEWGKLWGRLEWELRWGVSLDSEEVEVEIGAGVVDAGASKSGHTAPERHGSAADEQVSPALLCSHLGWLTVMRWLTELRW
jgi:hypothetical protein